MAVLAFHDELPILCDGDHIDPVGVFEYVEFGVNSPVRESHLVMPYCQPRSPEQVFAADSLPFAVVSDGFLNIEIFHDTYI